jgi:hypothetical protein
MSKLIGFVLLVLVLAVGWLQRDRLRGWFGRDATVAEVGIQPSPQLAAIAEAKLEALKEGSSSSIALHAAELESLLRYRFIQLLPAFVDSPRIALEDGKIEVNARVPVDRLPSVSELGEAASFLPDTTDVGVSARLLPLDSGRVALSIESISAAGIPLPDRLVPKALIQLGRRSEPGLPRNAVAVPLPPGIAAAYVRGDSLVLTTLPVSRSHN